MINRSEGPFLVVARAQLGELPWSDSRRCVQDDGRRYRRARRSANSVAPANRVIRHLHYHEDRVCAATPKSDLAEVGCEVAARLRPLRRRRREPLLDLAAEVLAEVGIRREELLKRPLG